MIPALLLQVWFLCIGLDTPPKATALRREIATQSGNVVNLTVIHPDVLRRQVATRSGNVEFNP